MMGIKGMIAAAPLRAAALALLALLAVSVAGCGADEYANEPRPPAVIAVSFFIGEDRIAYSPREFGGGPAQLIIVNQTGTEQNVTISSDRNERTVNVARMQTVKQKLTVEPGYLMIEADNTAADPLEIEVGPERESAQQDLNQP